jgi:hypothetical protein
MNRRRGEIVLVLFPDSDLTKVEAASRTTLAL